MHKFHKLIYDAMTSITLNSKPKGISKKMVRYLAIEKYIEISDTQKAYITEKGLNLLGRLEEFKDKDLSRTVMWAGIIASGVLSLTAIFVTLFGGKTI